MTYPNRKRTTRLFFERALELFGRAGIPVPVVSGGGSSALADLDDLPMLPEHRSGAYVYNDARLVSSGIATWDDCAMRVRTTIVSRPTSTRAIIDAGSKILTSDLATLQGFGHLLEYPHATITTLSEEHGIVDLSSCQRRPAIGDVVTVVPNHSCVVSNMVDEVYGLRGDLVETVWPVAARGAVR